MTSPEIRKKKCLLPKTNYSLHCNSEVLKSEAALWWKGKKEKNVQRVGDSTVARSGRCGVFIFTHTDDNTEVLWKSTCCAVRSERSTPPPACQSYWPLCKTFSLLELMCHLWPAVLRRIKLKGAISLLVDVLLREITVRLAAVTFLPLSCCIMFAPAFISKTNAVFHSHDKLWGGTRGQVEQQ